MVLKLQYFWQLPENLVVGYHLYEINNRFISDQVICSTTMTWTVVICIFIAIMFMGVLVMPLN